MSSTQRVDKLRFVGITEDDLNEFTCGICLEVFVNPVVTQCCRQTFCKDCIYSWLTDYNTCPNDRQLLAVDGLTSAPRLVVNLLNNLRIKCEYHSNGCQEVIKSDELANHLIYCDYSPYKKCKTCGSDVTPNAKHNCIEVLFRKNICISVENQSLREEYQKLIINSCPLNMEEVIQSARAHTNDCVIKLRSNGLSDKVFQQLVSKCKEAILQNNTVLDISESIAKSCRCVGRWQSIVSIVGFATSLNPNKYICLQFNKLVVFLFK